MSAYIIGTGISLPERVVTNEELSESLGLESEFIFRMSGIQRRRFADPQTKTSDLASKAIENAIESSNSVLSDIDYLLVGTMTPDRFVPGCAPAIQKNLGLRQIPSLDIRATCCNALYALQIAKALVETNVAQTVAIGLAEIQSRSLKYTPKSGTLSMLFGDGASAIIVSSKPKKNVFRIVDVLLFTEGENIDDLGVRSPGTEFDSFPQSNDDDFYPRMNGPVVIINATRKLTDVCQILLKRNNIDTSEVDWVVPHQANAKLLSVVTNNLGIQSEKVITVLEDFANTSSASLGIALDTLRKDHTLKTGDHILLPAFAAGFTWGAALAEVI